MTLFPRDAGEIEALVTDRYLDALLAGEARTAGLATVDRADRADRAEARALDAAVRAASRRLAADLPRFHPSFRFEERLALRLAEAAAALRLPLAAGAESQVIPIPIVPVPRPGEVDPLEAMPDDDVGGPLPAGLIRGAVAASALSLAGAAWLAWRRRAALSPMARAARAAHGTRGPLGRAGRV